MSEIFVAGDIHGNYQGLMESLNAASWQEGNTIICVGDVTDRGKDNARTVSFLQEHECDVRLVQGNHELQHKKLLQYYHVLIKVPQIRLFAAGIFRTYKAGYTYLDIDTSPNSVGVIKLSDYKIQPGKPTTLVVG